MFVGIVGFASATVSLLPARQWQWTSSLLVLGTAALTSVAFATIRARPRQLPADLLPDREVTGCSIETTTDSAIVRRVNELAATVYPGVEPLDPVRYTEWLQVNPNILVVLCDHKRRLQGYFDIFPLEQRFLEKLIEGKAAEGDIRTGHILPPDAARAAPRLYLAGVAVRDAATIAGKWHAAMLLSALVSYLRHFYGAPCRKQLVAIAATDYGEALLEKLDFEVVVTGDVRPDGKACYGRFIDADLVNRLSSVVGHWSDSCALTWERKSIIRPKRVRRSR